MLKDEQNTFKYAKMETVFLSEVFSAGCDEMMFVNDVRDQGNQVYFMRVHNANSYARTDLAFLMDNDFELKNLDGVVDNKHSHYFQKGMVRLLKMVSPEIAKQYVADLVQYQKGKIKANAKLLESLIDEQE